MDIESDSPSSHALIRLLRSAPDDPATRSQFVVRYGPRISRWCRARGLAEVDVEDLVRAITERLVARMHEFVPDPGRGFRDWLWTLAEQSLDDLAARIRRKEDLGVVANRPAELEGIEARRELRAELAAEFQLELVAEAKARVRSRVSPRQWEAFRMTVIEAVTAAETAGRIGMGVASVYNAKSKVLRNIQDEIRSLDGPDADLRRASADMAMPVGEDSDRLD